VQKVQEELLKVRLDVKPPAVDLVVSDVNMIQRERSDHPADVFWGVSDAIRPYGPILALPFLNVTPLSQFIPFSSVWPHREVSSNGYVLVALSIILSSIERRDMSMREARERILAPENLANVPEQALTQGLERLRKRIQEMCGQEQAWLAGVGT